MFACQKLENNKQFNKVLKLSFRLKGENNYIGASNLIITAHAPKSMLSEIDSSNTGQLQRTFYVIQNNRCLIIFNFSLEITFCIKR